jgi:hypothetical protein
MRSRMSRVALVALTLALIVGGSATASAAATAHSEARDAVDAIDDEFGVSPSERQCLTKAMVGDAKLVAAVRRVSLDLSPSSRQKAAVLKVLTRCAPGAFAGALIGEEEIEDVGASPQEVRCLVRGFPDLDDEVLIAASRNNVESLDAGAQADVAALVFRCMPTFMGEKFLQGMAASVTDVDPPSSDEQRRCVGTGVGEAFPAGSAPTIAEMEQSPDFAVALVQVVARCTPEFLVDVYTNQIGGGGVSRATASCMASGIVADPVALDALVRAGATGSDTVPPVIADLAAACS